MTDRRGDDLFLEALEQDDDVAWTLAEAAARPAPPYLRERIVGRHRRVARAPWLRVPLAAAAAIALVITGAALFVQLQGADVEVVAALAGDARVVQMRTAEGVAGRGAVVVRKDAQAYLVLDLAAPPSGKTYEAWVIRDGTPLRAGLAPTRGGLVTLRLDRPLQAGDVTAVTLEVASGVDAPTSTPVLIGPT